MFVDTVVSQQYQQTWQPTEKSCTVKQLRNLPGDEHKKSKLAIEVTFVKATT
jgi:hypothetical protein